MAISYRMALPSDLDELRSVALKTNIEKWTPFYKPIDLENYLKDTFNVDKLKASLENPDHAWYLALDGNKIIGYTQGCPCHLPFDGAKDTDGEVGKLYLLEKYQNKGIGTKLLEGIINWIESRFSKTIYVSVFSENPGAQRIYFRHGFEKVGQYLLPVGEQQDIEFILRREGK